MEFKFKWETDFKQTEIGEVPREWEVETVSEIVEESIVGSTPLRRNKKFWENGDIPWLSNKEVEYGQINFIENTEEKVTKLALEKTNLKLIPPYSLIISFTASVGKVVINKIPLTTNQQFISFILKNKNRKIIRYYGYYFLLSRELIESFSGATPFNFITKEKALRIPIPYPPLAEQFRIATVLSWFDDLIENKKKQNEILEKTAMAIFKSWFVDFEPFKNEEFVYSEEMGREIPKGWEVKPIGEVAEFVNGLSYRSNELVNNPTEGEIFITLKIFKRGGGFRPEYKYYKGNRYSEEQVVNDGDLVIALTDMTSDAKIVGAPALVILPPDRNKGILSLDASKLNTPQYMKEYAYLYLKDSQEENSTFGNGVNVLHLNLKLFKVGKFILLPPQPILQRFNSLVEPLFQKIILNQKQIMVLRRVRDALLPKLVFGKLRVVEI